MKKILLFLIISLLAIGCSNNNEEAGIGIFGNWELRSLDKGWLNITEFHPNEVVFSFHNNGILEVSNSTNVDLSPFVNDAKIPFSIQGEHLFINGFKYEYSLHNQSLRISHNLDADGPLYVFEQLNNR